MLVWPAMEISSLSRFVGRLKDRFLTRYPTVSAIAGDYRDMLAARPSLGSLNRRIPHIVFWGMLFALGLVAGSFAKNLAHEHLTIGHEDYRLIPADRLYSLNALRDKALAQGAALPIAEPREYPACRDGDEIRD